MSQVAFALRSSFEGDDFAGTVNVPGGDMLNVGEALSEGKGVIVTDDDAVITALDAYPALKRTTVPEGAKAKATSAPKVKPSLAGTSGAANEGATDPGATTPAVGGTTKGGE